MSAPSVSLRQKLKKNPASLLYARLADALREEGLLDEALPVVEAGLQQYPDHITGLLVKGRLLLEINEIEEAVQVLGIVVDREPCCLAARILLGDAYTRLGRTAEAQIQMAWLKDVDPLGPTIRIKGSAPMAQPPPVAAITGDVSSALDDLFGSEELTEEISEDFAEMPTAEDPLGLSSQDVADALDLALREVETPVPVSVPEGDVWEQDGEDSQTEVPNAESIGGDDVASAMDALFGEEDALVEEASGLEPLATEESEALSDLALPQEEYSVPEELGSDVGAAIDALFGDSSEESAPSTPSSTNLFTEEESPASSFSGAETEEDTRNPLFQSDGEAPAPDLATSSLLGDDEDIFDIKTPPPKASHAVDLETRLSSAFDELFGDEDLPEESTATPVSAASSEIESPQVDEEPSLEPGVSTFEKAAETPANSGDSDSLGQGVSHAFDDLFGDEEDLPEEQVVQAEEPAEVQELPEEIEAPQVEPVQESMGTGVSNALADLFGDDDDFLEDTGALEDLLGTDESPLVEESPVAEETPAPAEVEPIAEPADIEESAILEDLLEVEDAPVLEEAPPVVNPPLATSDTLESGVASALDALFGDQDDDFVEEASPEVSEEEILSASPTITLADIYIDQNLPGEALMILQQLQQRDPDNADVLERIARLQAEHPNLDHGDEDPGRDDLENPRPRKPRPGPKKR